MKQHIHNWQFSRIGGVNRVSLESGKDLLYLNRLDQKLWAALSCPTKGLEIDPQTLSLIDSDQDGKIRVPEILSAVEWITSIVNDPDCLIQGNQIMHLSEINTATEPGKTLFASAKQVLANLGKPEAEEISVEDVSDLTAIFEATRFNGDGIIIPESAEDEELQLLIERIIQCEGAVTDRSGKPGIDAAGIEAFYTHCSAFQEWYKLAGDGNTDILPYGEATEDAYQAFQVIRTKVDDYFLRCRLAEFDPQSLELLKTSHSRIESISDKDLPSCVEEIAALPLSMIGEQQTLSLNHGINPAWKTAIETFSTTVLSSVVPEKQDLTEPEWTEISKRFMAYENWKASKAGVEAEPLGLDIIESILSENRQEELLNLIAEDQKTEEEANHIILVEKMVRLYRDLFTFLNNFVTFSNFYRPGSKAIFQAGQLYFDQRCCDLCIKVTDMARHSSLAASSGICLVYFDCFSPGRNERMNIVAGFTDGDIDNLVPGRNGIFYDNEGNDWDATIIKIIDNPISIRQAFWLPYRKLSQFISKQVEKAAAAKDQEVYNSATAKVQNVPAQIVPSKGPAEAAKPAPFDIARFAGIFAAIGLAIGAIGGFLAAAAKGFFSLTWWQMPLALAGIMLLISGPSMILAWFKLRKRNLAPLLDANGWAINAQATINIAFGATLTHLAKLPSNAKLNFTDPYKKKSRPWLTVTILIVMLILIAYFLLKSGLLMKWGIFPDLSPTIGNEQVR